MLAKVLDRAISPNSNSSGAGHGFSTRKRRISPPYDGVYYTHEPLPNKPDIDFEDKDWDLKEDYSLAGRKLESPSKESDV